MWAIWIFPGDVYRKVRIYERYIGLSGQERIGFVDRHGRVFHHDSSEVRMAP